MSLLTRFRNFVGGSSSGADEELRGVLGCGGSVSLAQTLVARGFGYHVSIGAFSTPIVGGGDGTILDQDQPEGVLSVGAGYCLMPLRIHVQAQIPLGAADSDESEICIAVDRLAAWDGTGTVTVEEVFNMRTDLGGGKHNGPLVAVSGCTVNMTNPTLGLELAHAVKVFETKTDVGTTWTDLECLYEPANPPLIMGPAAIYIYFGGTVATTGFAQADVCCFPAGLLKSLA